MAPAPVTAFSFHQAVPDALARLGGRAGALRLLEAAIIVLLGLQAARLAWLLLPPAALGSLAATVPGPEAARFERLAIDAFYPAASSALPAATASGLRLHALRPDAGGGSAIIAVGEGPQRAYASGDEIAPGLRLAAVHADHAVLDAGGRRSELRFAAPRRTAGRGAAPAAATARPTTPGAAAPEASSTPRIDPAQLLAQAGLRPVEAGGRVTGYTVIPRGDGAVLRQAGLQAGDVLLSVNGEALTPERHAELGEALAGASTITLSYRRDGEIRTATLQAKTP